MYLIYAVYLCLISKVHELMQVLLLYANNNILKPKLCSRLSLHTAFITCFQRVCGCIPDAEDGAVPPGMGGAMLHSIAQFCVSALCP